MPIVAIVSSTPYIPGNDIGNYPASVLLPYACPQAVSGHMDVVKHLGLQRAAAPCGQGLECR